MKMLTYIALVSQTSAIKDKAKCPFGFTSGTKPGAAAPELAQNDPPAVRYPSEMFSCPTAAVMKTDVDKFGDEEYQNVVFSVLDQYEKLTQTNKVTTG